MPKGPTGPGLRVISRKGTQALYIRGTVKGVSIFETAGTSDPRRAEEYRALREAQIYTAAIHHKSERVTFAAAALSYLETGAHGAGTILRVQRLAKHWGPSLGCDEITQATLDDAGREVCRRGSLPATRHREVVTPTSAVLHFAARRGWCPVPLFEVAKAGGRRTDWITPADAEKLIEGAPDYFRGLLTFLFCTGARVNEALTLDWATVDLDHARATLRDTKSGHDRIVDLVPRAVALLRPLAQRDGRVFLNRAGKPYRDTNDSATTPYGGQLAKVFATTLHASGVGRHLTPHIIRHTWATWHYCHYRDPYRLRDDGGWRSASMVERYAKLAPEGLKSEIADFWRLG